MLATIQAFAGASCNGGPGPGGAADGNGGNDDQIWSSDSDTIRRRHICPYVYPDETFCGREFATRWARRRHQIAVHGRTGRSASQAWADKREKKASKRKQVARSLGSLVTGQSAILALAQQDLPVHDHDSGSVSSSHQIAAGSEVQHAQPLPYLAAEPMVPLPASDPYPLWPLVQLENNIAQRTEPSPVSAIAHAKDTAPSPAASPALAEQTTTGEIDPGLIDPNLIDYEKHPELLPYRATDDQE